MSESGKEAREREIGGMWEKIRADVAFDDVADDEVAPRSHVALTCHICLDQRVAFPTHQPTLHHHISIKSFWTLH